MQLRHAYSVCKKMPRIQISPFSENEQYRVMALKGNCNLMIAMISTMSNCCIDVLLYFCSACECVSKNNLNAVLYKFNPGTLNDIPS